MPHIPETYRGLMLKRFFFLPGWVMEQYPETVEAILVGGHEIGHHGYARLGHEGYHDNCTDNLRMALAAIGLRSTSVPCPLNLGMNTPVVEGGAMEWRPPVSTEGDHVQFRAELDAVVVISCCPMDLLPINGTDAQPRALNVLLHPVPE